MEREICLNCELEDCDEAKCPHSLEKMTKKRWYKKLKADPIRYAEYKKKKAEIKRKYLNTPNGKAKWNAQVRRYRRKHPEVMLFAGRKYHERNKEKRLADHREYMKKRRAALKNEPRILCNNALRSKIMSA